jgi:hypothetical protein
MASKRPIVNDSGDLKEIVDSDDLQVPASLKFLDANSLVSKTIAGRAFIDFSTSDSIGVANDLFQRALWRSRFYFCQAMGSSSTSLDTTGYAAPANTGATLTGRALAATNYFTRQRRVGFVSAATAGSLVSSRISSAALASLGDGAGLGGFFNVIRFGCSDAATVAGARMFVGATTAAGNPTNVEPSTLTNCIGVGNGASDTNLKLFYGGSSAQTPIDLGSDFPANTLSADVYELILYSPNYENATVYWQITRLNTGHVASGVVVGTSSAILPTASSFLLPWLIWRSNNATALAVAFDFMFDYFETDGF